MTDELLLENGFERGRCRYVKLGGCSGEGLLHLRYHS